MAFHKQDKSPCPILAIESKLYMV